MRSYSVDSTKEKGRLPDFIIIGAMRAGTTALAERLSRHPEIGMSTLKETDFFIAEKNFGRGMPWYRALFPPHTRFAGEASPNYTKNDAFGGVAQRIHKACPHVKLIYIVRDPVERFWSQYVHSRLGNSRVPAPREILDDAEGAHILACSMYHRQLSDYLDIFDRRRIHVADLADFLTDDLAAVTDILSFIGAKHVGPLPSSAANSSRALAETPEWALRLSQHPALTNLRARTPASIRSRLRRLLSSSMALPRQVPPMPPEIRSRVTDAVADDAAKFRRLAGRDFAGWTV